MNFSPPRWAAQKALLWREALEYQDWWTSILAICVAGGGVMVAVMQIKHGHPDAFVNSEQTFLLLRWCMGFFLSGCGLMAMAHSAHGIFDERQDRSIGFWQSWPISETSRLLSKSLAIALGWPLLAVLATLSVWIIASLMMATQGHIGEFLKQSPDFIKHVISTSLWVSAWSWPLVCIWLWCSAFARRSPWLWCWLLGAGAALIGLSLHLPSIPMGLSVALGPAYGALVKAWGLGETWIPWQLGSWTWVIGCLLGYQAIRHAAYHLQHQAND